MVTRWLYTRQICSLLYWAQLCLLFQILHLHLQVLLMCHFYQPVWCLPKLWFLDCNNNNNNNNKKKKKKKKKKKQKKKKKKRKKIQCTYAQTWKYGQIGTNNYVRRVTFIPNASGWIILREISESLSQPRVLCILHIW